MPSTTALPHQGLGLIKLDTLFPRLPGDLGLASSWGPRVKELVVRGALPDVIVKQQQSYADSTYAPAFAEAVKTLVQSGVAAITTSCGFLVLWQRELQALSQVPLVTSSLCLLPALLAQEEQVGVMSIDVNSLSPLHWLGAGLSSHHLDRLVLGGLPADSHFCQSILGNRNQMDARQAQTEVVAAARAIQQTAPHLQTLVLECTNLPPYQMAIEEATGLKVISLRDSAVLLAAASP
jgi:maleate cis-trans isomerase